MKLDLIWERAVLRQPLMDFEKGKKILVAANPFRHKRLGPTWFLFDGYDAYHVSDEYGGRNLSQLIATRGIYGDQENANARFQPHFKRWKKSLKSTKN